jgi:DNA-binding NarL/FixJ family response regulator
MATVADVIRILIVDDDPLVRVGLGLILGAGADVVVVGEAADGSAALAAVERLRPDVVLMDIRMPVLDGLAATEALRADPDGPAVIVLTTFDTDEHILRALRLGANGFLLKDTPPDEILASIRRVAAGESMLSPTVLTRLIDHVVRGDADGERSGRLTRARESLAGLSQREREVAYAVAAGRSNAEISAELFMSVATVKSYVSRIMSKLDCANRVQIAIVVHEGGHGS